MKSYQDKLKDPRWQKKRLEILERDEWTCQRCYSQKDTLNVHHRKYLPNKDPWECPNELLITLCQSCHEHEKEARPHYERLLLEILREHFLVDDISSLVSGFCKFKAQAAPEVVAAVYEWAIGDPNIQSDLYHLYFQHLKTHLQRKTS